MLLQAVSLPLVPALASNQTQSQSYYRRATGTRKSSRSFLCDQLGLTLKPAAMAQLRSEGRAFGRGKIGRPERAACYRRRRPRQPGTRKSCTRPAHWKRLRMLAVRFACYFSTDVDGLRELCAYGPERWWPLQKVGECPTLRSNICRERYLREVICLRYAGPTFAFADPRFFRPRTSGRRSRIAEGKPTAEDFLAYIRPTQ